VGDLKKLRRQLQAYAGQWVAIRDGVVVGHGKTPEEALATDKATSQHTSGVLRVLRYPRNKLVCPVL
jgi:hypothetical protein